MSVHRAVTVRSTGEGKFYNEVLVGGHRLAADEPHAVGGTDAGPTPYELLMAALGACTSMTLRMYADHKGLALGPVEVAVTHTTREQDGHKVDVFTRAIGLSGALDEAQRARLIEIAEKCPVHKTLSAGARIETLALARAA